MFNTKHIQLALLLKIGVISLSFATQAQSKVEFASSYQQPAVDGKTLNSYEISAEFSEEEAANILNHVISSMNAPIDEDSNWTTKSDGRIEAREKNDFAEIDLKTGELSAMNWFGKYDPEETTEGLLTGDDAVQKALKELDKLGLMPNEDELYLDRVGGIATTVHNIDDDTDEEHQIITTVRFNRKIDGIPVVGASRIIVYLGENGKLDGIIYRWPEVVKKEIPTWEQKNGMELKSGTKARLKHYENEVDSVTIKASELVLYDDGRGIIEPALHLQGTLKSKAGFSAPVSEFEPVMKNSRAIFPHVKQAALLMLSSDLITDTE